MKDQIKYMVVVAALTVSLLFSMQQCITNKKGLDLAKQNVAALTGTTQQATNRLGQIQYEKTAFMAEANALRALNSDLTKELEAQKGDVRVVIRYKTMIKLDTIVIDNTVKKLNDSMYVIDFRYNNSFDSTNSLTFNGSVPAAITMKDSNIQLTSSNTTISDLGMTMKVYTGIQEQNGLYNIYARTDFPGVKFDLDGAVIDPEKSFVPKKNDRFSFVLGGGLGYGATTNGTGLFPSVGIFVGINLLNF